MFLSNKSLIPLTALAVILIAGGVWYAQKSTTPTPPLNNAVGQEVKNSVSDVSTADWKTYRNEKYKFEFKYQPYWETAPTDVGINEENKHYLLHYLAFSDNKNKNSKNDSPLLSIALINREKDNRQPLHYGELIVKRDINGLEASTYIDILYGGYSVINIIKLSSTENLEIRIAQIDKKEEILNKLNEIVNTIKKF